MGHIGHPIFHTGKGQEESTFQRGVRYDPAAACRSVVFPGISETLTISHFSAALLALCSVNKCKVLGCRNKLKSETTQEP